MTPRNLNDAVVLVPGGNGVLGRAICTELERRGAQVVITARSNGEQGGRRVVVGDLHDRDFPRAAITSVLASERRLDGIVNAAGVVAFGQLVDTRDETLEALFAANTFGPLRFLRSFLAVNRGGFFASISGVVAQKGFPGLAAYSASKAAASMALQVAALEARRAKVDVIDVRAPHTETGLSSRPIAGRAPALPKGLPPELVAARIVLAIEQRERVLDEAAFHGPSTRVEAATPA